MLQNTAQTFNDGSVKIYNVDETTEALVLKRTLRYEERTVGMARYYAAKQANVKIDYLLRCLRQRNISTQDIAVPNDGEQYRIVQIQYPKDVEPPSMDMTLEAVKAKYDIYQPELKDEGDSDGA